MSSDTRFDERVEAFANYYSQKIYNSIDSMTFTYKEEASIKIIKELMLIFLEQCVTSVAPISKET